MVKISTHLLFLAILGILAQSELPSQARTPVTKAALTQLPTGARLDTAGHSFAVGNMPLAMILSPEGDYLVVSLSGWREQGLQVVERKSGRVLQTLPQPSAFLGLAFSPDGQTLYVSAG